MLDRHFSNRQCQQNWPSSLRKAKHILKLKDMNPGFDPGQSYHDPEALLAPQRRHRRAVSL